MSLSEVKIKTKEVKYSQKLEIGGSSQRVKVVG